MAQHDSKVLLKAIYPFKGSNNDELNFKKGDEIVLTQKEDGGWWEGTLDGRTGWFPSNYVKEINRQTNGGGSGGVKDSPRKELAHSSDGALRMEYRQQVVKDLIDKEKEFVNDLRNLHANYINPLHQAEL